MNKGIPGFTGYRNRATSLLQDTPQVLADTDRTHSHRSPGKEQIADFQGHKTTDISNNIIYLKQHISRIPCCTVFPSISR